MNPFRLILECNIREFLWKKQILEIFKRSGLNDVRPDSFRYQGIRDRSFCLESLLLLCQITYVIVMSRFFTDDLTGMIIVPL